MLGGTLQSPQTRRDWWWGRLPGPGSGLGCRGGQDSALSLSCSFGAGGFYCHVSKSIRPLGLTLLWKEQLAQDGSHAGGGGMGMGWQCDRSCSERQRDCPFLWRPDLFLTAFHSVIGWEDSVEDSEWAPSHSLRLQAKARVHMANGGAVSSIWLGDRVDQLAE